VRPLRPATDHRLGEPLPHQLANQARLPLQAACAFDHREFHPGMLCGISPGFPGLSPARRQVSHVLLTRSPLYSRGCPRFLVRLACVRHAASVDSEPGSNSRLKPDVSPGWRDCHSGRSRNDYLVRSLGLLTQALPGSPPRICMRVGAFLTTGTFNLVFKDRSALRLSGAFQPGIRCRTPVLVPPRSGQART
jgi:hypothetical protein